MQQVPAFLAHIDATAALLKQAARSSIILLHHNDADGLSSGAILSRCLEREGIAVRRICLEKPYPEVVRTILQDSDNREASILISDFGSGMLPTLAELNTQSLEIFVLDHHRIEACRDARIHLVNCLDFGIDADPFCSASTIAALFAEAISSHNADLLKLGIVGAVGDGLVSSTGHLSGLNELVADKAIRHGGVRPLAIGYELDLPNSVEVKDLVRQLNALGSFGYFRGGPDQAVKGLLSGVGEPFPSLAQGLQKQFDQALEPFLAKQFLQQESTLQWFRLPASFASFGVKTVGLVCELLISRNLVNKEKYLAGLQAIPNEVPGLGLFAFDQIKVSMRLPKFLAERVRKGERPSLVDVLPAATASVHGFVDACHPQAAATTIPVGRESEFLKELCARTK